jgi:hypothetical protein
MIIMNHSSTLSSTYILISYLLIFLAPAMLLFHKLFAKKHKIAAYLLAAAVVGFQAFHTLEHLIQTAFWSQNMWSAPYMTPFAKSIGSGLETIHRKYFDITASPTLGMELLHFYGNLVFLIGILALYISPHFIARRNLIKYPLVFEGVHLLEHTTLLISVIMGAAPWGASTLFSSLTGSQLSIHRIWWHLIMNFTAFLLTVLALTLKKLPALSTVLFTVITTNLTPIIVAYIYGAANSGYYSIDSLVSSKVILSLFINPIFFTGVYLIYKNQFSNPHKAPVVRK